MKKLFAIAAVALFASTAAATDLALWTFESSVPLGPGPYTAEAGVNAGTSNASSNSAGTFSNPVGNGSFESFSSNGWDVGDYYEFTTSTSGYTNIVLSFDQTSSNTGPRDFTVFYSVDGGGFLSAGTYAVLANAAPNPVWTSGGARNALYTSTFNIPGSDNAASLVIRLTQSTTVSANGGVVASTGTSRVDNVLIEGIVPTPGTFGLLSIAGVVATRRRRA